MLISKGGVMLGSVLKHFRDINFSMLVTLLKYMKLNLTSFYVKLKVSKLNFYM